MRLPHSTRRCVAAVIAAVAACLVVGAAAQAPTSRTADKPYTPPRTPWGDPDLQGVFGNDNEYATPLERPAEFNGKTLSDITADEMAKIRATAQQRMLAALPGGRVRGPDEWWTQNLDLSKRSQPWLIIDPADGKIPALTPEAQKRANTVRGSFVRQTFDGPEDFSMLDRCISRSIPGSMIPVMYNNIYEFVQAPGLVAITYEIIHEARVIPLDGRPHVAGSVREHMGDPRGHWEGNTLVVETTNFTAAAAYRGANAATFRVTERFTPVSADVIAWTATLNDPTTWTKPWTIAMPLRRERQPTMAYDCHEGNYGLRNILSAQRAAEKDKKE